GRAKPRAPAPGTTTLGSFSCANLSATAHTRRHPPQASPKPDELHVEANRVREARTSSARRRSSPRARSTPYDVPAEGLRGTRYQAQVGTRIRRLDEEARVVKAVSPSLSLFCIAGFR